MGDGWRRTRHRSHPPRASPRAEAIPPVAGHDRAAPVTGPSQERRRLPQHRAVLLWTTSTATTREGRVSERHEDQRIQRREAGLRRAWRLTGLTAVLAAGATAAAAGLAATGRGHPGPPPPPPPPAPPAPARHAPATPSPRGAPPRAA